MAIVRVDFSSTQPPEFGPTVSTVIDSVMQQALGVPARENFIICQGHPPSALFHAPQECSPARLEQIVFIQITLNQGRPGELKATFFAELNRQLVATQRLKRENIFINLVEVARDNWSFGNPAG